jgi:2-polyprenyl-6-methoxyphenol hydroxylase-like FAD-dependent oxidoreductase
MQQTGQQLSGNAPENIEKRSETTCCIVGAGPAGAVLALLLARKGVEVVLLEEHMDFARDFRGDTVHPSTMEIMEQIGLAERVFQLDHTKAESLSVKTTQGVEVKLSFEHLKTRYPYITLLPQVRFLEMLTQEAQRYPNFHLIMGARVEKLIEEDGYTHGVRYRGADGWHELRAVLTVGADGRFSRLRKLAGFEPIASSPPMDVLWFRLPRQPGEAEENGFYLGPGHMIVQFNRGDEWQLGYIILKGSYQEIKAAGIERLQAEIAQVLPALTERTKMLKDWKQFSVLSVESSRIKRWYRPGLLLIGDAAHVMSPVGGVGINYAVQDAVAAANILTPGLLVGKVSTADLARVQRRRELPTRIIQAFQRFMQERFLGKVVQSQQELTLSPLAKLFLSMPVLRDLPAKLVGLGPIREHVANP